MIEVRYDESISGNPLIEQMDEIILGGIQDGAKVCEIGTGTGLLTEKLAKTGAIVTSIDLYKEAPSHKNIAKRRLEDFDNVELRTQDVFDYPGSDYDFVIARFTYHHIEDKDRFIEKCYSLLRKGGELIIADEFIPNRPTRDEAVRCFHLYRRYLTDKGIIPAENTFDADLREEGEYKTNIEELEEQLRTAGFEKSNTKIVSINLPLDFELLGYKVVTATRS